MANTVYHYAPTSWVNGTTPANATNMNHIETAALDALSGLNGDLFTAFVLSGIVCTKDGTNANQLDIASGRAYVTQTDGTLALIVVASDNTHTTSVPSTAYNLYLQPDGTWYWSTSNTPQTNSLYICSVTTDVSGNINVVTDQRTTFTALLSGMAGHLNVPKIGQVNGQASAGAFGVPVVVAFGDKVPITTTADNTLGTFAVPSDGFYMFAGYFLFRNGSNSNVTFAANFTDPTTSTASAVFLSCDNGLLNALSFLSGTGLNSCTPKTFETKGGANINIKFHDASGTPNDVVSWQLWRLS